MRAVTAGLNARRLSCDSRYNAYSMNLSKLLEGVTVVKMFQTLYGQMVVTHDIEVRGIQYDSRLVAKGDVFVALRGSSHDGNKFVTDAVERGANIGVVQ